MNYDLVFPNLLNDRRYPPASSIFFATSVITLSSSNSLSDSEFIDASGSELMDDSESDVSSLALVSSKGSSKGSPLYRTSSV